MYLIAVMQKHARCFPQARFQIGTTRRKAVATFAQAPTLSMARGIIRLTYLLALGNIAM
jgi:hypothetical protein